MPALHHRWLSRSDQCWGWLSSNIKSKVLYSPQTQLPGASKASLFLAVPFLALKMVAMRPGWGPPQCGVGAVTVTGDVCANTGNGNRVVWVVQGSSLRSHQSRMIDCVGPSHGVRWRRIGEAVRGGDDAVCRKMHAVLHQSVVQAQCMLCWYIPAGCSSISGCGSIICTRW
jgi:hypothetical protein